jgi:hypothetical protein
MGERLNIDLDRISEVADQVAALLDRFSNAKEYLGGYRDAIGHHGLADEMDSFHKDWRVHREELTKRLGKLAGGSKDAVEAFRRVDGELAKVLQQQPAQSGA